MKTKDFLNLLLLSTVWGASFLFIRVAAPAFGPFLTVELRVAIAAIVLLGYAYAIGYKLQLIKRWKEFLVLGALNAAIPFVLISTAELHITASLAAILNATTPLFTALVAWAWNKEQLGGLKIVGLLMGVLGVGILVGWSPAPMEEIVLVSVLFSLLAALSYGIAGIYTVRRLKNVKPLDIAIGQQLGASILILPFAIATLPEQMPSLEPILSILGLSILCTSFAYIIYFQLIQNIGPVKTISVTFMVPIFGIIWSVLFLGELIYVNSVIGLVVILISLVMVLNLFPKKEKRLVSSK